MYNFYRIIIYYTDLFPVTSARITPEMLQYVQRLVGAFGINVEGNMTSSGALTQEALAKRAQAAAQDPAFQRLKNQFANDFDFRYENLRILIIIPAL